MQCTAQSLGIPPQETVVDKMVVCQPIGSPSALQLWFLRDNNETKTYSTLYMLGTKLIILYSHN